jgi:uncharacterized membrane protein YhaH (DUF805 family)
MLFNFLIFGAVGMLADVVQTGSGKHIISILQLVSFLPGIAVFFRRMHDIGKSGLIIIPITIFSFSWVIGSPIGNILTIIALLSGLVVGSMALCRKGDVGENKYGSDPKMTT